MPEKKYFHKRSRLLLYPVLFAIILSTILSACAVDVADAGDIDQAPLSGDGWQVSTPEEQGLDPDLIESIYKKAGKLDTLYGMIVIKNGYLVAEKYFNGSDINHQTLMASVSKSYISALIGLALEQGCLESLDQKMLDFFPEYADQITDPRKETITIRHLLQMRSGFP